MNCLAQRPSAKSSQLKNGSRSTCSKNDIKNHAVSIRVSILADARGPKSDSSAWTDGWDKKIPTVAPNFIIPPPSKGSQYDSNKFNDNFSGVGDGNGGNRGGAFNLFTGGFFGPNGGGSILKRLRLLIMFCIWSALMYSLTTSIIWLARTAVSSVKFPAWGSAAEAEEELKQGGSSEVVAAGDCVGAVAVASSVSAVVATSSPQDETREASEMSQGSPAASHLDHVDIDEADMHESTSSGVLVGELLEADAVEARAIGDVQRAYLDLLSRHGEAHATAREEGVWAMGSLSESAALFVMIVGCVTFFNVVS
ncbi:hypothetical protein CEUSTIGMA_g7770.t1 [Chlamydomonas eustigma]|uniref:Uncharacterized protein n=1 Tax=Chlamydomonas eustigma TaxID=1157962 RepID=A0A250XBT1_9CHLO|nr:hypothetical protein CEUSTIGMA_g7770.t1 [Chlamydomonas eustigma]|eukprot:GAX80332.1 hypothetical protein CEUSTIGMA_g7770.t1 [Chlamydomonas eustigma]